MKKLFALLLVAMMITSMVACGYKQNQDDTDLPEGTSTTEGGSVSDTDESTVPDTPELPAVAFDGTAADVLTQLVAKSCELDTTEYGIAAIGVSDVSVDEDSCTDILGLTTEEFTTLVVSAIESKPTASYIAHSVVVIELAEGVDVEGIANKIITNTKPNRFGCLKPSSIVGGYSGQFVYFCASSAETTEAVWQAFEELSQMESTRIDRENTWSGGGMGGMIG